MKTKLFFLVTALLGYWIIGCLSPSPIAPESATILWWSGEKNEQIILKITDKELLAKWEACFPNCRNLPSNDKGGFGACHVLYFAFNNGLANYIVTDGTNWSNSKGIFAVSNDIFKVYRESLQWVENMRRGKNNYLNTTE